MKHDMNYASVRLKAEIMMLALKLVNRCADEAEELITRQMFTSNDTPSVDVGGSPLDAVTDPGPGAVSSSTSVSDTIGILGQNVSLQYC